MTEMILKMAEIVVLNVLSFHLYIWQILLNILKKAVIGSDRLLLV